MMILIASNVHATQYPIKLGNATVIIEVLHHKIGKSFVHLHQNETTALEAAKFIMQSEGGSLLTLHHDGGRNIVFFLHHQRYEFDPNRIFTDEGIKKTLHDFGAYSKKAHHEVRQFANKIKSLLPKGKIIAVHNNETYSLKDYLPGHSLFNEACALHLHEKNFIRNFFVVTHHRDFSRLKDLSFNSILQAPNPTNDGSLSVFLAKRRYINVEAGYNQLAMQIDMLKIA